MLLSVALGIVPPSPTAGEPPRLVGEFGGRAVVGRDILLLDLAPPAIRLVDRWSLRDRTTPLAGGPERLDPYGIAAHGDGTVSALADRGRSLVRFSPATGEKLESRRLPEPGQGVTGLWNRLAVVAIRLRGGEPLLLAEEREGFRPFSPILSRPGANPAAHLIGNLLRCGSGTAEAIPCWFLAGPPEVVLVRRNGTVNRVPVPSFAPALPRAARGGDPGAGFVYPVRDAFLEPSGLWVLSNQEGERTPLEEGAVRSRHVARVHAGRARQVVALDREARAILDAGSGRLVMLYADGSFGSVVVR